MRAMSMNTEDQYTTSGHVHIAVQGSKPDWTSSTVKPTIQMVMVLDQQEILTESAFDLQSQKSR